jgi:WD40 repeat protein
MRRVWTLLFIASVLLTACGAPAAAPAATSPAVPTQPVVVQASDTPEQVASSTPASTAIPVATSTAAPTIAPTVPPASSVIGLDNFSQLVQLHDYSADYRAVITKLKGADNSPWASTPVLSPDGKMIAFCVNVSFDSQWPKGDIVILDAQTGDPVSVFPLNEKNLVYNLAFTPDGKKLVYFTDLDNRLVFWDIAAQREDEVFYKKDGHDSVGLALSPDGKQIISLDGVNSEGGAGASLTVWDAKTSKILRQMPADYQYSYILRLSADGSRLVVSTASGASVLTVYDTATWKVVSTIRPPGSWAELTAISPNGAYVLTGNSNKGDVLVWNAATGKQVGQLQTPFAQISYFDFNPAGSMLIVTGNPPYSKVYDDSYNFTAAVFDSSTWKQVGVLPWGAIGRFHFSPDGKNLMAIQSDGTFALFGLPDDKIAAARQVAADFTAALIKGDYASAAPLFNLYPDELKALQGKGLPTDPATILQMVCAQGVFPCLPATVIYTASQASDTKNRKAAPMYYFLAQYTQPDGSLYRDANGLSMMTFYVVQDTDGKYKVDLGMDLVSVLKK